MREAAKATRVAPPELVAQMGGRPTKSAPPGRKSKKTTDAKTKTKPKTVASRVKSKD